MGRRLEKWIVSRCAKGGDRLFSEEPYICVCEIRAVRVVFFGIGIVCVRMCFVVVFSKRKKKAGGPRDDKRGTPPNGKQKNNAVLLLPGSLHLSASTPVIRYIDWSR